MDSYVSPSRPRIETWTHAGPSRDVVSVSSYGGEVGLRAGLGMTVNGGNVSRWEDQSGNQSDAAEAAATRQSAWVGDGLAFGR